MSRFSALGGVGVDCEVYMIPSFKVVFYAYVPFGDPISILEFDNLIVLENWEDCIDVYCDDGCPCHRVDYSDFDFYKVIKND